MPTAYVVFDDNNKDNEISQSTLDACNHKIQNEKGNLSLWRTSMPLQAKDFGRSFLTNEKYLSSY